MPVATPFPVCVFPFDLVEPGKLYVFQKDAAGVVVSQGWIAKPGSRDVPDMLAPDGAFYYSAVDGLDGQGLTLYRTELVDDDQEPVLESRFVIDLDLPTGLAGFMLLGLDLRPIWLNGQAAMIGAASYQYDVGPGREYVGVVFTVTPAGLTVHSENKAYEDLAFLFATVDFEDGSFASFDWSLAV